MNHRRAFQFKVGDTHTSGETISFIFGHSTDVIVFRDGRDRVQWEINSDLLSRPQSLVHQLYDRLHDRVVSCLSNASKRKQLTDELAQALFLGLSEADEAKALKYFENVVGRIAHEAQIEARFTYLVTGSVAAGVILAVGLLMGYLLAADVRDIVVGAVAGSIGAWASILSRASQLELGPFETPTNLKFQGFTRILLGMVFGVIAIVAMKTGQLFPSSSSNLWITTLTTFVSGWSERLIPEIISKIETRAAKAAATSTTT
jgi:hypothetical protein